MKNKIILILILLSPIVSLSQELNLKNIKAPREISVTFKNNILLSKGILGPRNVDFLEGFQLQRRERGPSKRNKEIDKLKTLYSGKIYSERICKPFIFKNKTPKELAQLKISIFPKILEQPYDLFLDLEIKVYSTSIKNKKSSDAGEYKTRLVVKLIVI